MSYFHWNVLKTSLNYWYRFSTLYIGFVLIILMNSPFEVSSQESFFLKRGSLGLKTIQASFESLNSESIKLNSNNYYLNYRTFNKNNFSLSDSLIDLERYNQMALFIVYKSIDSVPKNIVTLTDTIGRVSFGNNLINDEQSNKSLALDASNGVIVCYELNSYETKFKRSLSLKEYLKDMITPVQQILEIIILPYLPNNQERNIIESYLSIKYGISLIPGTSYFSSKSEMIWDGKSSSYQSRVTGIGFDYSTGLDQRQSQNSSWPQLAIGYDSIYSFNFQNKVLITGLHYCVFGDNGKDFEFKTDIENGIKVLKRDWRLQLTGNVIRQESYHVKLSNFNEALSIDSSVWLVVTDSTNMQVDSENKHIVSRYYKGIFNTGSIDFNLVSFGRDLDSNSTSYFTFIQTGKFAAIASFDSRSCACPHMADLYIKTLGGKAPFTYEVIGPYFSHRVISNESEMIVNQVLPGEYVISVVDSLGERFSITKMLQFQNSNLDVYLPEMIYFEQGLGVELIPVFLGVPPNLYQSQWYNGDNYISNDWNLYVNDPGKYSLILTNQSGCKYLLATTVSKPIADFNECIKLFPNPVRIGQLFELDLSGTGQGNCDVYIIDSYGRIIKHLLTQSSEVLYSKLFNPGFYVIKVETSESSYQIKLVVI